METVLAGVFGLLIGSFLNVLIYRLPKMMERQWAKECAELSEAPLKEEAAFNLLVPRSRCPHCNHMIRWYENIPVISLIFLRGKCAQCQTRISARYPLVELATGALFAYCISKWGLTATGAMWCIFSATLLALALIDWDTTLLPDDLTLPLLWLGLVAAEMHWIPVTLSTALWGALGGYLSLWSIYWVFKLVTGKEGMGYGDFKLFAVLGVWFGWQTLLPMILMASIIGAIVGIAMKVFSGLREGGYIPFGPFLAGAGLSALILGPDYLRQLIGQ
jgi:leader peptidase (prepilin peptidase)/N-methyltransferase